MTKRLMLMNLILIPYHAAVVFAMAMSMAQARTNQEIFHQLYWIVPVNFVFASLPTIAIALFWAWTKKREQLKPAFLKAEGLVVCIQLILHGALLLFSRYGPAV